MPHTYVSAHAAASRACVWAQASADDCHVQFLLCSMCTFAQVVAADVLSFNQIQHELQARQASVSKSEAREQAAIIQ